MVTLPFLPTPSCPLPSLPQPSGAVSGTLWTSMQAHGLHATNWQLSSMGTIQTSRPPGLPELQSRPPVTSRLAAVATHCISNGAIWT
ncbi:hypothetical protein ARSEF4850_005770 [Beauveria asiatica]